LYEGAETAGVRVCLAALNFHPVYAGPAVRFTRYLPGLTARGLDLQVFTGTPETVKATASNVENSWRALRIGRRLALERVNGVSLQRVRLPDARGMRRTRAFARELARFCAGADDRPEVVQLLTADPVLVPTLLSMRRQGIATVYTDTMVPAGPSNRLKRELWRTYVTLPHRLLSCVVVSSEVMRNRLYALGSSARIEVIPNGVDTSRFRPARDEAERAQVRQRIGIHPDDFVLLFVGPINRRKGADRLLEAWGKLASRHGRARLIIVGPRFDVANPRLRPFNECLNRLLASSGAEERVRFTGLVDKVEEYMRAADLLLFTSRWEGMPNVIPEAMASGLPVISTPFDGFPAEFGVPDKHFVLAEGEPRRFAAAVEALMASDERRRALADAGRRWVEDRLDVEISLDSYAALYRELARDMSSNGAET
jgi:glycosyltransferase involved in cell wall biosynthesis